MEDLKEEANKKSVRFLLVSNLGDDFTYNKQEVGIINHTVLCKPENPVKNPVVLQKCWLWINSKYKTITHFWNGKQWVEIIKDYLSEIKSFESLKGNESTIVILESCSFNLDAPKPHKKITIKNGSNGFITIYGNFDNKENNVITIESLKSVTLHGSKNTWWIL